MSSFKNIGNIDDNEVDVIVLPGEEPTIQLHGIRYRKLNLELPGYHRQDLVTHYLITLKEAGCKKVYYHGSWYYEIKPHVCPLDCIDSEADII